MKTANEICPTTTMGRVKEGALLVDVREKSEVAQLAFDVPNIINIPFSEFEERYNEIPKDREVILVCMVGERSLKTAYYLLNQGYEDKGFPTTGDTTFATTENSGSCCSPATESTSETTSCCEPTTKESGATCC